MQRADRAFLPVGQRGGPAGTEVAGNLRSERSCHFSGEFAGGPSTTEPERWPSARPRRRRRSGIRVGLSVMVLFCGPAENVSVFRPAVSVGRGWCLRMLEDVHQLQRSPVRCLGRTVRTSSGPGRPPSFQMCRGEFKILQVTPRRKHNDQNPLQEFLWPRNSPSWMAGICMPVPGVVFHVARHGGGW